jgi:hypothetical protein
MNKNSLLNQIYICPIGADGVQLAVAWCGSFIVAKTLMKHIRENIKRPYSSQQILQLIHDSGLLESELESVSFIFFGHEPETESIFVQDYLTGQTSIGPKHKFKYAGSGTFHFFDSIAYELRGMRGEINEFETTFGILLSRISVALYEEVISDINHNYFYGGGFEILGFNPNLNRFEKIPLSFVFWSVTDDGLDLCGPILSQSYSGIDALTIRRLSHNSSGNWALKTYMVASFLDSADVTTPNFSNTTLDTPFTVHFLVRAAQPNSVSPMIKKGEDTGFSVSLNHDKKEFVVDFTKAFAEEALAYALRDEIPD